MFSNQQSPLTLRATAPRGTDAPCDNFGKVQCRSPVLPLNALVCVFGGAARHLRRGGRDLGRLTTRPGEGPPQTPSCSEPAHHDNINVCTLSHARDIWALYSLLDGEPSQPSTGIRSIPDHFSSIGWPRPVPSLKPGDFKQPGSLLRQLLLA